MEMLEYGIVSIVLLAVLTASAAMTPFVLRNPALSGTVVVAVFALLAITPLCGLMFDCGCNWPWHGLHLDCNYFVLESKRKCPWCGNAIAGGLSTVAAIGLGSLAAYRFGARPIPVHDAATIRWQLVRAVGAGGMTFHVVALIGGIAAALLVGHPLPFAS